MNEHGYYELNVAGLTRQLPLCQLDENLYIAAFVMFSDIEMTVRSAEELIKKIPECDVIVTPECKSIPLAYEMAKQLGIKYFVVRKVQKLYMANPYVIEVKSITTAEVQKLYLDGSEAEFIRGKRVLIVDDVISTGQSLKAVEELVKRAGADIVGKCAVLAEGDAAAREDIIYLENLPLISK